jgi:hypothetical protein
VLQLLLLLLLPYFPFSLVTLRNVSVTRCVSDANYALRASQIVGNRINFHKQWSNRQGGVTQRRSRRWLHVAARCRPLDSSHWQNQARCLLPPDQAALRHRKGSAHCLMLAASGGTRACPQLHGPPVRPCQLATTTAGCSRCTAGQHTAKPAIQTDAVKSLTVFSRSLAQDPAPEAKSTTSAENMAPMTVCLVAYLWCAARGGVGFTQIMTLAMDSPRDQTNV